MLEQLPILKDDGLKTPEVGPWAEQKYRLVWNYAKMFASSMKYKWDSRIYIDLFAGSGRAKLKNISKIVPASPLLAINIPDRFDKYFFCEENKQNIQNLETRVKTSFQDANVDFIPGDVNRNVNKILSKIPQHRQGKILTFCFADPYKVKNLNFRTIKDLSERFVDFLILIPTHMDANRNVSRYTKESNLVIENFTGCKIWRKKWELARQNGKKFCVFLAELYTDQMKKLNYIDSPISDMVEIRSHDKNLPLYNLAFFSRNKLGIRLWKNSVKYSNNQLNLFFKENYGSKFKNRVD